MHRFLRKLACDIAANNLSALRLDYRGTGDSLGSDADPDLVPAWRADVRQAVEWLRRETGVAQIALVGVRVGALLATQVAAELGDIDSLALVGPVISGKSYLRESRALAAFINESTRARADEPGQPAPAEVALDVAGFTLTPATIRDLEGLDLRALGRKPANRVLLLAEPDSPAALRLAAHVLALGAGVTVGVLPGLARMEWNSSLAVLPDDTFVQLVKWLAEDPPPTRAACVRVGTARLQTSQWQEEPLMFGPDDGLFAIHCAPAATPSRRAMLIVNHGSNHHIGWARMYVTLARRLAAQGIGSMRMDIAGLGDSATRPGQRDNQLYAKESVQDIQMALETLHRQGYDDITLIGHCSGAHLGFYAAVADERVNGLVMVNLQRFFWEPGDSLQIALRSGFRSTAWYLSMLRNPDVWVRLLRGSINISGIARAVTARILRRLASALKSGLGNWPAGQPQHQQVLNGFQALSKRGARVLLVYSAEDGGLDELALYGGRRGKRITRLPDVQLQIIAGADHNLTPRWARERYFNLLEHHFGLRR